MAAFPSDISCQMIPRSSKHSCTAVNRRPTAVGT